jgi:hypothetical protein
MSIWGSNAHSNYTTLNVYNGFSNYTTPMSIWGFNAHSNYTTLASYNGFSNYITPKTEWSSNSLSNFSTSVSYTSFSNWISPYASQMGTTTYSNTAITMPTQSTFTLSNINLVVKGGTKIDGGLRIYDSIDTIPMISALDYSMLTETSRRIAFGMSNNSFIQAELTFYYHSG